MSLVKQYVGVYLLDVPYQIDRKYDYYLPPELIGSVVPGQFVTVPFGTSNRKMIGVVTELRNTSEYDGAKPVYDICASRLSLSGCMLELCFFLRERTLCSFGDAVRCMVPPASAAKTVKYFSVCSERSRQGVTLSVDTATVYEFVKAQGRVREDIVAVRFGTRTKGALSRLRTLGLINEECEVKEGVGSKFTKVYSLAVPREDVDRIISGEIIGNMKRRMTSKGQIDALVALTEGPLDEDLLFTACGAKPAQIKALCDRGIVSLEKKECLRNPYDKIEQRYVELIPNDEQSVALNTLTELANDGKAHGALLHGVTGSGKTCVIMGLIDGTLKKGRQVIVLLPEIALTPQMIGAFCSRYGDRVAVWHSGLSAGERYDSYIRLKSGKADIAVGTRSAIFSPLDNIGLIVIDEEQEHTYKSDTNPKYHARDVARWLCARHNALMVLSSATPSLESYKKAVDGVYTLVKLRGRFGSAGMPRVTIADMRDEAKNGNSTPIGTELARALIETHKAGEQSVLFLNRRGYNNFVSCVDCGSAVKCPNCSVSMTYHTRRGSYSEGELVCHWCGKRMALPRVCPECAGSHIVRIGYGTQRVEQELSELMPNASVIRFDADATGEKHAYDELLGRFRRGDADVLLGTQMVTKGHDFPRVTLVGVLLADMSLYLDDYRAGERTFAMLTQVIGRAGRADRPGHAIIQTNNPDNDIIKLACAQDYETFYSREIKLRRLLTFPPFCDIVLLSLSHTDEKELLNASVLLTELIKKLSGGEYGDVPLVVFGPFEAPVYKVDGRFRMRAVIKCVLNARSRELFGAVMSKYNAGYQKKPVLSIDFNPTNI